jgi:hypothetical protein
MKKQAIAEGLMSLAGAFSESPFQRDLKAMSMALEGMSQEKYAMILAEKKSESSFSIDHNAASFAGKGAYTGAVLELEKILDKIFEAPSPALKRSLENLSPDKFKRLKRLHKSLQSAKGGAFRWASMEEIEKEAILGFGQKDPLTSLDRVLKKYEQQTGERILDLPPGVARKYQSLENEIEKQQARRPGEPTETPKEPGLVEKGRDVGRALGEKGLEVGEKAYGKVKDVGRAVGEKAKGIWEAPGKFKEDIAKRYEQFQQERAQKKEQAEQAQAEALGGLGNYLARRTPFNDIFYSLPPQIIRELEAIGLTPETVKATGRSKQRVPDSNPETVGKGPSESVFEPTEELTKVASDVVLKYLKAQNDYAGQANEELEASAMEPSQSSSENDAMDIDQGSYRTFGSDSGINAEGR